MGTSQASAEGRRLYLTYFAAMGAVFPFQVLYLQENGLSATQIGFLGSLAAAVAVLPGLLWVTWADRSSRTRPFMLMGFGAQMAIWLVFPLASKLGQFLLLMVAMSILVPPMEALMNVWALSRLDRGRVGSGYALIRIWGSIGWMASAVITGALVQASEVRVAFLIGGLLLFLCLIQPISESRSEDHEEEAPEPGKTDPGGFKRVLLFGIATAIRAFSVGMSYTFVSVYLDRIGTPFWLMGWGWAISASPEIPIMVFAGKLSDRIGRVPLLMAGYLCSSSMAFGFAMVSEPLIAVPLMSLSGVSYGLTYISSVGYLSDVAPRNRRATAQGLYTMISTQIPRIAGPYLGGVIIDTYGLSSMYLTSGVLTLVATSVLLPMWFGRKP